MGIIREEIEIVGIKKSKKVLALFDSGAYRNYIKMKLEDGDGPEDIGFHIFEGTHTVILANEDTVVGEKVGFKEVRIKDKEHNIKEPRQRLRIFASFLLCHSLNYKI